MSTNNHSNSDNISNLLKKYSKNTTEKVFIHLYETPIGSLIAAANENYLCIVAFKDSKNIDKMLKTITDELNCTFVEEKNKILDKFDIEINNYFNGKLRNFTIPIKTFGSEFQQEVWNKLLEIPYGSTDTYGNLAKVMGRPVSHSRAVGAACGANAHIILIPCHRMVASGSKGGFSSGLDRKEWLLNHEKKFAQL